MQYVYWLKDAVHGDFGESTQTKRDVSYDVSQFLPATLELIAFAAIIEIVFGLVLGGLSARYSGKWIDNLVRLLSYFGIASPSFVLGIVFMLIFSYYFPIQPAIGRISPGLIPPHTITGFYLIDSLLEGNLTAFADVFTHLIMPGTALALQGMASAARLTRSSMLENMNKDYVGSEIASGIPMRRIYSSYLLKPSATPTVSIIALDVASMLGNAFLVETIFSYPGISQYGIDAILKKDLNAIVAVVLVIGITFLVVNIVVDIIAAYLDPRIRYQRGDK